MKTTPQKIAAIAGTAAGFCTAADSSRWFLFS